MKNRWIWSGLILLASCASAPKTKLSGDPLGFYRKFCANGKPEASTQVAGEFSIQIQTRQLQGTFPGSVKARPGSLTLAVTHIFGGTLAQIKLDKDHYVVDLPINGRHLEGDGGVWSGLPMEWLSELFRGVVPCKAEARIARFGWTGDGALIADDLNYFLEESEGKLLVKRMRITSFEKNPDVGIIDLDFSPPDLKPGAFSNWQIESKQGRVRIHWSDRQITVVDPSS